MLKDVLMLMLRRLPVRLWQPLPPFDEYYQISGSQLAFSNKEWVVLTPAKPPKEVVVVVDVVPEVAAVPDEAEATEAFAPEETCF